ncbi:kyphoscoliosis peptidase-like isoform X2 [Scylla paramamosain]|uniref:kyphoscoliosis peptidase-like isoform X2 n=1 Tax=Scylla paramamosain TaxID=85552 RepID=UPI0030834716
MGMGTLVSSYPRGLEDTSGGVMVPLGIPQSVLTPLHAWEPHAITSEGQESTVSHLTFLCAGSKGKNAFNKVPWVQMMEASVQTEAVAEEDLDWDLSNLEDKETQTLPQNPTPFQLNRTDAFVQTDYRYLPLTAAPPRPSTSLPVKLVDRGTQTEVTTSSVSTQTEEPYLPLASSILQHDIRFLPGDASEEREKQVLLSDASSGPSISGLGSALPRPQVLQTLPGTVTPMLPDSPPNSPEHPLSLPFDGRATRKRATEQWMHLKQLCVTNMLSYAEPMQTRLHRTRRIMVDACVQTDNDILTDEAPQFAACPPNSTKAALLSDVDFTDIDVHVLTTPDEVTAEVDHLVRYLGKQTTSDLYRLRALFRWVTENIRFDWKCMEKNQTAEDVLGSRAGVSRDYVTLLVALCHAAGLRVKKIHGFARGRDFKPGRQFDPERDPRHTWMAVFLYGSWRLLDPTWSAGYTNLQGKFVPHPLEHYFLTDPQHMIYTHLPYDTHEHNYDRWQLLEEPLNLEEFNALPKVLPEFWSCGLRLHRPLHNPVVVRNQIEVTLMAPTLIRYKYKFFPDDQGEDSCINQWVFCTLKEGGGQGSFTVIPPECANYVLKIYAGPEQLLDDNEGALDHVVSFLLMCEKARRYPVPWPLHDVAWGPSPRLYQCGLDPVNQSGPVIVTWGGKKVVYFEKALDVMLMFQVFDANGNQLDHKGLLGREETEEQLRLVIVPPGIGYFKLLIYGIPRPQVRGRWRLPLLASYLIECKMSLRSQSNDSTTSVKKGKKTSKKISIVPRR